MFVSIFLLVEPSIFKSEFNINLAYGIFALIIFFGCGTVYVVKRLKPSLPLLLMTAYRIYILVLTIIYSGGIVNVCYKSLIFLNILMLAELSVSAKKFNIFLFEMVYVLTFLLFLNQLYYAYSGQLFLISMRTRVVDYAFPVVMLCLVLSKRKINLVQTISLCVCVIIAVSCIFAYSVSTGIIGLILAVGFILLCEIFKYTKHLRGRSIFCVGLIIFLLITIFRVQGYFDDIIYLLTEKDVTFTERTAIWDSALEQILNNIVFGNGFVNDGNFIELELFDSTTWQAHNAYLQIIWDSGIVGLLLIFGFILSSCWTEKIKNKQQQVGLCFALALLIMMNLEIYTYYLGFYIVFAVVFNINRESKCEPVFEQAKIKTKKPTYANSFGIIFSAKVYFCKLMFKLTKLNFFVERKHKLILKKLKTEFEKDLKDNSEQVENIDENSKVYIFWWQGIEDNSPDIVKACLNSVRQNFSSDKIVILSKNNLSDYIELPEHILEKVEKKIFSITLLSDIIRASILYKYGGIWLDATCLLTQPIFDDIKSYSFYSNKLQGDKNLKRYVSEGKWSAFFIAGSAHNEIFGNLQRVFFEYTKKYNKLIDYYLVDYIIRLCYENLPNIKSQIDAVPENNQNIYALSENLFELEAEKPLSKIISTGKIFKLSYKFSNQNTKTLGTIYKKLLYEFSNDKIDVCERLVSVIIPVYNAEKYLSKCLESVLCQTHQNIEVVVVDDGSTDKSLKIIEKFRKKDKRIKVIKKQNGGVSSARNAGLDCISGEFVVFVDSDDYLEPSMIEQLLVPVADGSYQIAMCAYNKVKGKNRVEMCAFNSDREVNLKDKKFLLNRKADISSLWNKIYSRKLIQNIRFNENFKYGEDQLFNLECYKKVDEMFYVAKPLYNYRTNDGSAVERFKKEIVILNCKLLPFQIDFCKKTKNKVLLNWFAGCFLRKIITSLSAFENKDEARRFFKNARKFTETKFALRNSRGQDKLTLISKTVIKFNMFNLAYWLSNKKKNKVMRGDLWKV